MITEAFIIFVIFIIVICYIRNYYGEVEIVKAETDGRRYIMRKLPDRQEGAELLARVNERLIKLVSLMKEEFPKDRNVMRMAKNFDPNAISEGGNEVGYTSYSVNKGEKIILCIRQPGNNKFVDENIIVYVALHELAHLMTKEVGHTKTFWENFKRIAIYATDHGIYKKVDFAKKPEAYCGIKISTSII